ncbi:MAG: hypothetical protein E4H27_02345 [Anaerolineales bacterium]|nr:MAG: hypothetical protein E4H27_02345 [Anaerolineales bacterium]
MQATIIADSLVLTLYGFVGQVADHNYSMVGKQLMDAMWKEIALRRLAHKGINHWVYESEDRLFVGVELDKIPDRTDLICKEIVIPQYAYWKHVGDYSTLGAAYEAIYTDLRSKGVQHVYPHLEIYGHWTDDTSQLETELIISIT